MKLQRKNLMLSVVEEGNNLMITRLAPVATLHALRVGANYSSGVGKIRFQCSLIAYDVILFNQP